MKNHPQRDQLLSAVLALAPGGGSVRDDLANQAAALIGCQTLLERVNPWERKGIMGLLVRRFGDGSA